MKTDTEIPDDEGSLGISRENKVKMEKAEDYLISTSTTIASLKTNLTVDCFHLL